MPVTIVATPGASNANSYLTLAEAQTYFDSRLPVAAWDDAVTDTQNRLLVMATRVMDAMARPHSTYYPGPPPHTITSGAWTGAPATSTQSLAWPRTGMYDANGNAIASTVVPDDLKEATAELAGQLATADTTIDNAILVQGITSIKAGSVSLSFKDMIERHVIPDMVYSLMPASWFTEEVYTYLMPAQFDVVSDLMSLLDVLRIGIKTAHDVLKPLEANVSYQRVTARDGYGEPSTFASVVTLTAIVDFRSVPVRNKEGITVYSSATLTFLDLAAIEAATGGAGMDVDDLFTLADGTKGKVLSLGGFMDAGTTQPLPVTVMIG